MSEIKISDEALLSDIRRQLKGHPDSKLEGEHGLAAATMRRLDQLEECCRTALWIQSKLEEMGKWGAHLEEWEEIRKAMDSESANAELEELRKDREIVNWLEANIGNGSYGVSRGSDGRWRLYRDLTELCKPTLRELIAASQAGVKGGEK